MISGIPTEILWLAAVFIMLMAGFLAEPARQADHRADKATPLQGRGNQTAPRRPPVNAVDKISLGAVEALGL
jgi:hypothetical protein